MSDEIDMLLRYAELAERVDGHDRYAQEIETVTGDTLVIGDWRRDDGGHLDGLSDSWDHCGEYLPCDECNRYMGRYDTYVWLADSVPVCERCATGPLSDEFIEELTNNPDAVIPAGWDIEDALTDAGYHLTGVKHATGWYSGMDDDPVKIVKAANDGEMDIVLQVTRDNPFATWFTSWVRQMEQADKGDE